MSQPTPSEQDLRRLLYNVLGKWRSGELSFIRHRVLDIEDKIDALENRELKPSPNKAAIKSQLEKDAARMAERKDEKVAMIEETYKLMIDFVDRRECEAD